MQDESSNPAYLADRAAAIDQASAGEGVWWEHGPNDEEQAEIPVDGRVHPHSRRNQIIRYVMAGVFATLMVFIAEVTGEKEVIFPEVVAILTGMWVADETPWAISGPRLVILLSASALLGYVMVVYLPIHIYFKYLIGFSFAAVGLTVSRSTVFPMVSAGILPVMMGTDSLVYPISVFTMMVLIAVVRWWMMRVGLHKVEAYVPVEPPSVEKALWWAARIGVFMVIAVIPIFTKQYLVVVPPLIVAYTGFTSPHLAIQHRWKATIANFAVSAVIGFCCRYFLNMTLGLPLTLAAACAVALVFVSFELFRLQYPPVGAIALLPMLVDASLVPIYPIEVSLGSAILLTAAHFIFGREYNHRDRRAGA